MQHTLAPARFTATQLLPLPVAAVDYETHYSSDYSVSDSSYWHYTHDPRFRAYLVSIVGPDFTFVGDPKDFDWSRIDGMLWVSHNRAFDKAVYERLCELGVIGGVCVIQYARAGNLARTTGSEIRHPRPFYWADTAALSVFLRAPRSLAGAVQALYGITRSKEIRNVEMKGKQWEEFTPELQERVKKYAIDDAEDCRKIWIDHWQKWPDQERWISDMLAERGERGFHIDLQSLESDITFMKRVKFEAERKIPWSDEHPVLSPKALRAECARHGIGAPASFSLTDEECAAWEDKYGDTFEWIAAVRTYRRANTLLSKLEAMRDRVRPDGRMQFQLAYHAAHTGRSGGTGGVNMLNQPRAPFYVDHKFNLLHKKEDILAVEDYRKKHVAGALPSHIIRSIDFRSKLLASPGHKLVVGDLAQIEARCSRFLARDWKTLQLIEGGLGVYEAHARRFMGFEGVNMKKTDPAGYQLAKARELALGFGVGAEKFAIMARSYVDDAYYNKIFGAPVSSEDAERYLERMANLKDPSMRAAKLRHYKASDDFGKRVIVNAWLQVNDFREKNPELVAMWRMLDDALKQSVGETYEVELPSGRTIQYFNVTSIDGGIQARTERGGPFLYTYGPKIFENLVQATARDVFIEAQLRAEEAGIPILLDVYDELVADVEQSFDPARLETVMTERPTWAKRLPIGAEVEEMKFYSK